MLPTPKIIDLVDIYTYINIKWTGLFSVGAGSRFPRARLLSYPYGKTLEPG